MDPDPRTACTPRLELSTPSGRRVVPLVEAVTRIGRANDYHVQIAVAQVSEHHAEIVRDGDEYLLRDVGSKTGVFCNGQAVREHRLRDGERIVLGRRASTTLVFRAGGQVSLSPGDAVVLYTDGILEAMSPDRELFGEERLVEALHGMHGRSAQAICDQLPQEVAAFSGATADDDDTTVLVVAYREGGAT